MECKIGQYQLYCDRVDRKEKSVEMRNVCYQKTNVESH